MAKNPRKSSAPTKKHLARQQRERMQTRYILIGSAAVLVAVIGLIIYGILDQTVLRQRQPVAIVNNDPISTTRFQEQVRYQRFLIIRNAQNTLQFMQLFGNDPSTASSFASQLQQYKQQMQSDTVGKQVLDLLIDDKLIRQEAARLGITVTEDEIQKGLQAAFGYYPNGTPTPTATLAPIPTSTLSPLQETLVATLPSTPTATPVVTQTATPAPTASPTPATTPTPTQVLTPTATTAPSPTPTEYTLEGYQKESKDTLAQLQKDFGISEDSVRYVIESSIYREKVMGAVITDVARTEEQVWARHILVSDEATAKKVLDLLNSKQEAWDQLAAEYSQDTSNKDRGGDLGWFPKGQMDAAFETAAFSLKVGEVSQPVKSSFGWHIIQVLGHEDRPLSSSSYEQLLQTKFQDWLDAQRKNSNVAERDYWPDRIPPDPTMPAELEQQIDSIISSSQNPPVTQPTAQPQTQPTPQPQPTP